MSRIAPPHRHAPVVFVMIGGLLALGQTMVGAQTIYTVTTTGDGGDANTGNGICDDGSGNCTLRAAIEQANATGADSIHFNIPGAGPHVITVGLNIPVTDPVVIDGYTQSGASPNTNPRTMGTNAIIMIEIDVPSILLFGLRISAGSTTVRGVAIRPVGPFSGTHLLELSTNGGNVIEGVFIGTNAAGDAVQNPITAASGVKITSPDNTIGGTAPAARNLIAGVGTGISIETVPATGNIVQGNLMGTNAAGTANLGFGGFGVAVGAFTTTIGGTADGAGNVIAGGTAGVRIRSQGTVVQGNLIGTDVTGTAALGNDTGILIDGLVPAGTLVGGPTPEARNVVSGNGVGILVDHIDTQSDILIQGNYVGLDITGTTAIGTTGDGVRLSGGASLTTIGGSAPGAGNVIAGAGGRAISIEDVANTTVQGNLIGTDASGEVALGNDLEGIHLLAASNTEIGGAESGAGNTVAFSGGAGVAVDFGTGNAILGNAIHGNGGPGIDLEVDGVTANDVGDGDTGANDLQNFPALSMAITGSAEIEGTFNGAPSSTFRLEFFSNDACSAFGFGEGQRFLGFTDVTTDGSGDASFSVSLDGPASPGNAFTATATDAANNTSEFSQCVTGVGYDVEATANGGSVLPGEDAAYDVTVTAVGGTLDRDVTLSCDGLPAGASCAFTPGTVQPGATAATSSLIVSTTNPETPTGANAFSVVGTVGAVARTATATVTVADFTVAASPDAVTVPSGQDAGYDVTVTAVGGTLDRDVTLSCDGLPAGASCAFTPATVQPGATAATSALVVSTTTPDTPTGANDFTVVGTLDALERNATATVIVTDFAVAASPDTVSVAGGQNATYTITVSPDGPSFAGAVALSCSGLPAGASCTFAPTEVTPGTGAATATLTLSTAALTSAAGPTLTGPRPHLPAGRWQVIFTLAALTLAAVLLAAARGPRPMRIAAGVLVFLALAGVACGGDPNEPTLPVSTTFTVTGTSGALVHSATATVTVQ